MRKLTLAISAAALAIAGAALAQPPGPQRGGSDRPDHGPMTRADVETHVDRMFARLDANGDGKLDPADREAHRSDRFDRLDADNSGSISREEFDAAAGKLRGRFAERGPGDEGQRFEGRRFGARRFGGPEGLGGPGMRGRHGMGLAMIGKMADTDGDGAISKDEFRTASLARFDRADANGDGTVSPDEHKAMRDAHSAARDRSSE